MIVLGDNYTYVFISRETSDTLLLLRDANGHQHFNREARCALIRFPDLWELGPLRWATYVGMASDSVWFRSILTCMNSVENTPGWWERRLDETPGERYGMTTSGTRLVAHSGDIGMMPSIVGSPVDGCTEIVPTRRYRGRCVASAVL